MSKTIIIGTSAAGMAAAHKLRQLMPHAQIICITRESELPYNRCLLADLLAGSKQQSEVMTKSQGYFQEHGIDFLPNFAVAQINTAAKKVVSTDGTHLSYDNLVIAAGRSARVPASLGQKLRGVFPFYDLAHVEAIRTYASEHCVKQAVVVGAGLSGLECSDALASQGIAITLVEQQSQVLPQQIDKRGSEFMVGLAARHGVNVLTGQTIIDIIAAHERAVGVILADGRELQTDMIVFATGGRQNLDMLAGSGIMTDDHGIVVDSHGQTSVAHVYAAGDICSVPNLLTGGRTSSCLWPDAVAQGMTAACHIAGTQRSYAGALSITSSHIFGTTFVTCGNNFNRSDCDVRVKEEHDFYHRFYLENDVITGFVMVGNIGNLGQLRAAILAKQRIE